MARTHIYNWPLTSTTAICALQTLAGAGAASINGALATPAGPMGSAYQVVLGEIGRTVSITSANNLAGVNFTIAGYLNGAAVSTTIAGPNATTVYTTAVFYDVITSVTTNAAAAAFSVGTGTTGVTHWFNSDQYQNALGLGIQVVVGGTITYSFLTTLDDPSTVTTPTSFTPIAAMTAATTNQLGSYLSPTRNSRIAVTASDGTGTLTATFTQQGK